ncbi:MAG: hypothetical protein V1806_15170 [Pseudomonadota bacterium]
MPDAALVFPRTALRRSLFSLLWPLFQPVLVLEPSGLSAVAGASPLEAAGLVERRRPPYHPADQGADQRHMARLLSQWEAWAAQHKGSVLSEAFKAGIELPDPDRETYQELRKDIKSGRPEVKPLLAAAPRLPDDLFLRLMQLQDQEAAQMEELQAKVESGQDRLSRIIGLEEEDVLPADYEEPFGQKLPPLDYDLSLDPHLARRLEAWAGLARRAGVDSVWLATADMAAAGWLMAAANRRLLPGEPAGTLLAAAPPQAPPDDSPLAREAARLVLPDLAHLDDEQLLGVGQALARNGVLDQMRQGLHNLLTRLAVEPWSAALCQDLAAPARMLAESLAAHLAEHLADQGLEPGPPRRGLSILALPGLTQAQALGLLAGGGDEGLPALAAWPARWPAGSCPIIAAW